MTDICELEAQKKKLYARMKEVRAAIDNTRSSDERRRQQERLRVLRDMYRDACDQLEAARPAQEKRRRSQHRSALSVGGVGFDFFERCGMVWSDLEGCTWNELQDVVNDGSARDASFLLNALKGGLTALTDNQRECVMALYARGMGVNDIAAERGVRPSTISRTLRTALERLEAYIVASLRARECLSPKGFDFLRFAESTEVLTERQREYLYFLLTDGASLCEIARFLELEKSTMSRGSGRIEANLSAVKPGLASAPASRKVRRGEWAGKSEKEIAAALGISPAVYYRNVCRGETVGGLPRLAYEILRLNGMTAERAAEELGLTAGTVRRYRKKYRGTDVSHIDPPERYTPRKRCQEVPDLRRMLKDAGGGTIGDRVDAGTYRRMVEISRDRP